jgi:hypothetical protein
VTRIKSIIKKLKSIQDRDFLFKIVKEVVIKLDHILIDYNVEDQLFERGVTSEGVSISSYAPYSPITVSIKKEKGQKTRMVTLRDEGDFHESFFLEARDEDFEIYATDVKTGELVEKYGDEIFGITEENIQDFIDSYLREEINKAIRDELRES